MKIEQTLKKAIDADMEKIEVPPSLYDFARNIKTEAENQVANVTPLAKPQKCLYFPFAAAAVIGIAILAGSTVFRPALAQVASKIPYLNQVFESKPVDQVIYDELIAAGYENPALGMSPGDKVQFTVNLTGTKEYADRERPKVTKIVEDILKSSGYDSYKITVSAYMPEFTPLTDEEKRLTELGTILEHSLRSKGYEILTVNPFNSTIEIEVPLTETRLEQVKKDTVEMAAAKGVHKEVTVIPYDVETGKRENAWMDFMSRINEGLALKKEYHVVGYQFSYDKNHLTYSIKTDMDETEPNAATTVVKIRAEIEAFLASEEVKEKVGNDTYELIILNKDGNPFTF